MDLLVKAVETLETKRKTLPKKLKNKKAIARHLLKMENIEGALNEDNDLWQRIAMLGGWPKWQLETKNKKQSSSSKNNKKGNLKIKGGITFRKKKIKGDSRRWVLKVKMQSFLKTWRY